MNHALTKLHEDLLAVKGLLDYPWLSEERRKQLEELKVILEERLLSLLAEVEALTIS
jgi:hypothetical protein